MRYLPNSLFAVPFCYPLKRNLRHEGIIAVYGVVPEGADRFVVNLLTGPEGESDHALHVSFRFPENVVVLNTKQYGSWMHEERVHHMPIHPGHHFQMLIYVRPEEYKIAFNGVHFADFQHRMPAELVSHVAVSGDVHINTVSGVRTEYEPDNVIYNPEVPFVQAIGEMFPGRLIRVRGIVPHGCYRFSVNLMDGPDPGANNTHFHVSVRPNSSEHLVELNSKQHGSWGSGVQIRPCPVQLGQAFELLILVGHNDYKVAFNGQHFAEFPHRLPMHEVSFIRIVDDVQLSKISYEGRRREDDFGFVPLGPPAEQYFHPHAYEAFGTNYAFANPYPIY